MLYCCAMSYVQTAEASDIMSHLLSGQGSAAITATAGSGKTETLVRAATALVEAGTPAPDILLLAYNKSTVDTLVKRLPPGMVCRTQHALGFSALRQQFPALHGARPDARKYSVILRALTEPGVMPPSAGPREAVVRSARELLARVRQHALRAPGFLAALRGIEHDPRDAHLIVHVVAAALREGERALQAGALDYGDMVYAPWKLGLRLPRRYPWVFLDEAQDASALQIDLVLKSMAPGGRAVVVGDPWQGINGWAGADREAMRKLTLFTGAKALPLSTTWRCPRSHVMIAKAVAGNAIRARAGAPNGRVTVLEESEMLSRLRPGDLVLCRNNAPLLRVALQLMARGVRVCLRGQDMREDMLNLAREGHAAFGRLDAPEMLGALAELPAARMAALRGRGEDRDPDALREHGRVCDVIDALSVLLRLHRPRTPAQVQAHLDGLFSDAADGAVLLSSVHRAKGLEAERVYVFEPQRIPAPFGTPEEEDNVLFVALTRSRKELHFVGGLPGHTGVLRVLEMLGLTAHAHAAD